MDEKEVLEFDLDDIMKEFGGSTEVQDAQETAAVSDDTKPLPNVEEIRQPAQVTSDTVRLFNVSDVQAAPVQTSDDTQRIPDTKAVTDDTVRIADTVQAAAEQTAPENKVSGDTIRLDKVEAVTETVDQPKTEQVDPFTTSWEPEYDQPMGKYVPPQPMVFHPKSRLRELKRKLVAGPEKQYYALSEKGMGKLQLAIFFSLLVALAAAVTTVMHGSVPENRLKLMIFSQLLAMMVSALLGSFQLIEGVADLFKGRFTLNTLLVITLLVCGADGVMCLQEPVSRIPCCAAFSLEMTMSLWGAYHNRHARLGQLDTMRKANHLDGICVQEDYYEGKKGFLRCEGQVEDFMDHYDAQGKPEKRMNLYALIAFVACIGIGVTAGVLYGVRSGIQVGAVSLLAAVPATAFITVSRPFAILTRKLHDMGAVLCGWKSIEALKGKAAFPIDHADIFPSGTVKMNGVKFYGSREPDQIVAFTAALMEASGSGLSQLFIQLLESRNGPHFQVQELREYNGGVGGIVEDEAVLIGSLAFLKEMGVEVPEGIRVNQAVYVAVDGELAGLFALTYEKDRASAAGMVTLCSYRGLSAVLTAGDFMLTESFLHSKFGIKTRRLSIPEQEARQELIRKGQQVQDAQAQILVTSEGLAPFAYGVTGARALRTACKLGMIIHMIGGALGMGIMLTLTLLGALQYIEPVNMFLYQLVWMIPGLLITEWTRSI